MGVTLVIFEKDSQLAVFTITTISKSDTYPFDTILDNTIDTNICTLYRQRLPE
jgi:uncharacterized protein YkuJ